MHIIYACNDAYVRQTLVSMVSVIKQHPDVKLYLAADQISADQQKLIRDTLAKWSQAVTIIDLADILPKLPFDKSDRHPKTVYAKLFLDEVIPADRVLYLDSDVVVMGSLEPLFTMNLEGKAAAGVLMPYSVKVKKSVGCEAGQPYVCDGVVLINLEHWRKTKKAMACRKYITECQGMPPMLSEGTLNHVCGKELAVLAPKYNVMPSMLVYNLREIRELFRADYYYADEKMMQEAKEKPVVMHFMNELYNRPWFEPCDHPFREVYREEEKEVFGKVVWEKVPLNRHTQRTMMLRKWLPFGVFAALYRMKNRI